ncbi:MAG: HlyC/CorC family transporter [Erysipelotrichaceae bacterium]|nr:HlyC/CorC family transporter [Erysipelotrichaceae bacterium]
MNIALILAGIAVCIFFSNFFSGSEIAYSSCNKLRLENEAEDGSKDAELALQIAEHFNDALGTILIGNNLVNITSSSLASVAALLIVGNDSLTWAATLILTILVIIFGETIPKITVKRDPTRYAVRHAAPIRFLMILLKPLVMITVFLVDLITRGMPGEKESDDQDEKIEELQTIIETAENEDVIDEDESELVQAAIGFSDVSAAEAMTARVDVVAIDIDDSWEEVLAAVERSPFTRIPVYEGSIDHVIGVLHLNRFFKALIDEETPDLRSLLMEPCYVYKTMKLPEVLKTFRKARQHLAIVGDEYGGTLGIISMEDVLEQVVGEIWDESDVVEDEVVKLTEKEYEIDGDMPIAEFLDLLDIREDDFEAESETVGGWTIETFGTFPEVGNSFHAYFFTVTVLAMEDHRVEKVLVTLDDPKEE